MLYACWPRKGWSIDGGEMTLTHVIPLIEQDVRDGLSVEIRHLDERGNLSARWMATIDPERNIGNIDYLEIEEEKGEVL